MPTYNFRNKKTGEIIEVVLSISELDNYKKQNPLLETYIAVAPAVTFGGRTFLPPAGFREVLAKIGEQNPNSNVSDEHRKRSIKEIKTKEIIMKHAKKAAAAKLEKMNRK